MGGSSAAKGNKKNTAADRAARADSRSAQSSGGKDGAQSSGGKDVLSEAASRKRVTPATSPPSTPEALHGGRAKRQAQRIPASSEEDELATAGAVETETVEERGGAKLKAAAGPKVQ